MHAEGTHRRPPRPPSGRRFVNRTTGERAAVTGRADDRRRVALAYDDGRTFAVERGAR